MYFEYFVSMCYCTHFYHTIRVLKHNYNLPSCVYLLPFWRVYLLWYFSRWIPSTCQKSTACLLWINWMDFLELIGQKTKLSWNIYSNLHFHDWFSSDVEAFCFKKVKSALSLKVWHWKLWSNKTFSLQIVSTLHMVWSNFFEKLVITLLAVERISVWFGHLEAHAWKDNISLSLLKVSIYV